MRPEVMTQNGPVEGLVEQFEDFEGYSFKGIPYAADTSGENRWRAPQDRESWTENFDASSFGPQCPQFRMGEGVLGVQLLEHMLWKFLMKSLHWSLRIA